MFLWLAKTLEYYEAKGDNLFTLGSVEKVKEEIGNRLGNKLDEIESNIENYLIQYYTPTFIESRLKLATDRNIVDDITHWTQIKEDSSYRDEVIQGKREEIKGAILYNTSYLKNSSDYSNEFKLLFLEDMMANRYSFDNEGNIKRQKVKPSDYKTTDSPVIQINSMALSSTYQNDKNKVLNYGDGNKTNFNVGANHLLAFKNPDISIISKEKYKKYFVKENNEISRRLNESNIQYCVLRDFFNMYLSQTEDVSAFYGKAIIELSVYQLKLAIYARVFFNIFQYHEDLPERMKQDPVAIFDFVERKKNNNSKSYVNTDKGASAVFGATKEDLEIIDPNARTVSLSDEISKNGGVMNMDQLIELMG
jgi:hypothetical protein